MDQGLKNIIVACLKKDLEGQKALYELFLDRLYFIAIRYVSNQYYVENILQDVFLKVFNNLDKFDSKKASFNTWITTITIRECLNHLRKKVLEFEPIENDQLKIVGNIDPLLLEMDTEELIEAISSIPDKYRVVFNLFEIDGYSHKEISEELQINTSTSRSYLTRAKKQIQSKLINHPVKLNRS